MKENTVKSKTIIIVLTAIIVLLVGAGVTVGIIMLNGNNQPTQQTQGIVFDNNASHYEKKVENKGSDSGIKIPGYPDMTVDAGTKDFPITLLNPKGNPCNFKFTLTLADTGEDICTTNLVKPGDAIKGVTLDKALSKGEYTLLVNIATYATDSNKQMNGAQVKAKLTVK